MLLPLASSTVSEALALLSRIREFEPPAGNFAVEGLGACIKQLPLCVQSAEDILPVLQACCSAMCKASGRASDAAMPSYAYMLGSAVASLHRCYPCLAAWLFAVMVIQQYLIAKGCTCRHGHVSLLQAVTPFGIDINNTVRTLPPASLQDAAQGGILCVLDRLATLAPAAILEVSGLLDSDNSPVPWSLRWCILAGSLCDLANNHSSKGAAFWNGLLSILSSPQIQDIVDMWGDERKPDIQAVHNDAKGEVWGQWLAAALLSGMMPEEQLACPQHLLDVLFLRCSAPQGMPQISFTTAMTIANCSAATDMIQGCRVAVSVVVSISVCSIANSQVCYSWAWQVLGSKFH